MYYSRSLVTNGADPLGSVGRSSRRRVFATSFADPLSARLAQGASIDNTAESGTTTGTTSPVTALYDFHMFQAGSSRSYLLIRLSARLQGAFLSQKLQFRL